MRGWRTNAVHRALAVIAGLALVATSLDRGIAAQRKRPPLVVHLSASQLVGAWSDIDPTNKVVPQIVIAQKGTAATFHWYGACSPKLCDNGTVPAHLFSNSVVNRQAVGFTASSASKFSITSFTVYRAQGDLKLIVTVRFTDKSGRSDFLYIERMARKGA